MIIKRLYAVLAMVGLLLGLAIGSKPVDASQTCYNLNYVNLLLSGELCHGGQSTNCKTLDMESSSPTIVGKGPLPARLCITPDPYVPTAARFNLINEAGQLMVNIQGSLDSNGHFEAYPILMGEMPSMEGGPGSCRIQGLMDQQHMAHGHPISFVGEYQARADLAE